MSAEPFALKHEGFKVKGGYAVLESLIYPESAEHEQPRYRTARLTIRGYGWQYAVFAGSFSSEHARDLAEQLPPATRELHGLKLTAGRNVSPGAGAVGTAARSRSRVDWHLQVDDAGDTCLQVGDIFTPEGLGQLVPLEHSNATFEEHSAKAFYRRRRQANEDESVLRP